MKRLLIYLAAASMPGLIYAQSAIDAYQFSQHDLKGSARFMSMGGAFTALGGDLSSVSQNPAGIGIYRNSEIGFTVNFDIQNSTSETPGISSSANQFKFLLNNAGYIGAIRLPGNVLKNFNWGFTYNKAASFNRKYSGKFASIDNSLSNYIAGMSNYNGVTIGDVETTAGYDPYNPNDGMYNTPWLSILAYDSYLINPVKSNDNTTHWQGLYGDNTTGTGYFNVLEEGGVDEYNISFGGNFADILYWGMDFGITGLNYTRTTLYGENLNNAYVGEGNNGIEQATANWDLYNEYSVNGSGFNYKLGLIFKPIQELRIGFAFHTPTWYALNEYYCANTTFDYGVSHIRPGFAETNNGKWGYYEYKFRTPWRITAGVAGVIANRFIVSADYEWMGYQRMKFSDRYYDFWDQSGDPYNYTNMDIKDYYSSSNIFRIGAEARVTSQFSVRIGYNHVYSPVKSDVQNNSIAVQTAGTRPEYTLDNSTDYYTAGLGYRYKKFYVDAAYVHKHRASKYHAFAASSASEPGSIAKISSNDDQIVLSLGIKF